VRVPHASLERVSIRPERGWPSEHHRYDGTARGAWNAQSEPNLGAGPGCPSAATSEKRVTLGGNDVGLPLSDRDQQVLLPVHPVVIGNGPGKGLG
jgi:hypothetical protein